MSTADTKALIEEGIANFQKEVPALARLKLVMELELRGRGDIQLFRVEVPGPKVTRDIASDAKVRLSIPRSHFNELAREGTLRHWRDAFESVGSRHLRGCYADHDDIYSKLRVLRRDHVHQFAQPSHKASSGAEGSASDEAHTGARRTEGPTSPPSRKVSTSA